MFGIGRKTINHSEPRYSEASGQTWEPGRFSDQRSIAISRSISPHCFNLVAIRFHLFPLGVRSGALAKIARTVSVWQLPAVKLSISGKP